MSGAFTKPVAGFHSAADSRRDSSCGRQAPQNISQREKFISMAAGGGLLIAGLSRGKAGGLLLGLCGAALAYRGWTGHCQAYQMLGVDTSRHNPAVGVPAQQGYKVQRTLTIHRTAEDLFAYWRDLKNLPRVMRHLKSVDIVDEHRSRWTASGPLGVSVHWEAEIFNEREPELIAWRSLPGAPLETAGSVRFSPQPHDRGTAVTVSMKYNPPAGKVGATIASLLGSDVEQELDEDLRRFKSMMEAGEIPTV
jgi:uncharacterized membrane protein